MDPRRITVFYYGLFMDANLLRQHGASPTNIRRASAPGFALRIGQRATLVTEPGAHAHGVAMDMTHAEIDRLYGAPSLQAYRPEAVLLEVDDGVRVPALCYNLVVSPAPDERNADYAAKLRQLAQQLKLPQDYIRTIE